MKTIIVAIVSVLMARSADAAPLFEVWLEFCNQKDVCREVRLPLEDLPLPFRCMELGQYEGAKYVRTHPELHLARWRCGKASVSL